MSIWSICPSGVVVSALMAVIFFSSCSHRPAPIGRPNVDASAAGRRAMELYDKNNDGKVSGDELDQAPALKAAMKTLDTDGDMAVSAAEVTARVNAWKAIPAALTTFKIHVTMDGQPLGGAKVVFEPDPCLGDDIKPASGTTNLYGDASPTIPPEQRPSPDFPGGAQFGLYLIRITKDVNGKETIPAIYNAQTTLGQEVAYDDPAFRNRNISFALKSTP